MDTDANLPPFDPELLTRVLAGHASAIEWRIVERWADEHPRNAAQWAGLQEVWRVAERRQSGRQSGRQSHGRAHTEVLVQTVLGNIAAQERVRETNGQGVRLRREGGARARRQRQDVTRVGTRTLRDRLVRGLGAIVAMGVIAYGVVHSADALQDALQDVLHARASRPANARARYVTAATQVAHLSLDDGTRVTLAPQTTLIVGQDFNHGTRTVTLDGEAFFDVSSRLDAPLIVRTGELTTRVLGTRFDVRRYTQDRMAQIVVTEGKVVVSGFREQGTTSRHEASSPERTVVLAAGMMGLVTDTTTAVTTVPDVTDYTRWTQGMMVFRRTPLPEVLATIGHWYGLTFRLADSTLAEQHLTATFDHRSLDDILATIGVLLDVSMTADSTNVITLHAGRRSRSAAPTRNVPDARLSPYKEIGR